MTKRRQPSFLLSAVSLQAALGFAMCVLLTAMPVPALAGKATGVTAAHLQSEGTRTRIELELTKPANYAVFGLGSPYRLIIDLPNVEFKMHEDGGPQSQGLVTAFRFGLVGPDKSRAVLSISGPFVIERAEVRKAAGGKPAALVVVIAPTDAANFSKTVERKPQTSTKEAAVTSIPKPHLADPRKTKPVVIVDAGHGGPDSGAVSPQGLKEKHVVLAMALAVRDKLVATGRYKVLMTRDADYFVTLNGRIEFARRHGANLFVSVHADSAVDGRYASARGASVYSRADRASSREAELVALKENLSDVVAGEELPDATGDVVTDILMDLVQRETRIHSQKLADDVVSHLKGSTSMTPEPNRHAAFYVLKSPDFPSILIELAFVSNREDEKLLGSQEWRNKVSTSIVEGIERFFEKRLAGVPFQ